MSLLSPQLEAFIAIVKYKTVHAAAGSLYLTQTAVTQRLKILEKKLNTTLFIRRKSGMLLTQEGEALLQYCNTAKHIEKQTLSSIQGAALEETINLTISGPSSLMTSRIIPACMPVMKNFPKLLINFLIDDVEQRHEHLKTNLADLAITQQEDISQEFQTKTLASEKYLLVCSSQWANRSLQDIIKNERIIDFNPSDQVSFNYLKKYKLFEAAQKERYFVNRTQILASLISEQFGYGLLAEEFIQPYLNSKELIILNNGKALEHTYSLAWYHRPEPPAYFQALLMAIC